MADRMMMTRRGDALVPADNQSLDELRTLPMSAPIGVDTVQVRNLQLHRKCFAMVKLSFDYWEPENYVTTVEKDTVRKLAKFLAHNGMDAATIKNLASQFLGHLNRSRGTVEAEKSFEAFRDFITVESGFYDTVMTPAGPRKIAKSWAFKNMSEAKFEELYKAVFNTCWNLILKQSFANEDEAEAAAMQLLEFS